MEAFAPLQAEVVFDVASDPISAILLVIGAAILGFASLLLGYMTVRGLIAGLVRGPSRGPPRRT